MLFVGQILQERYKVVQQLSKGGMGIIYEAIDNRLNSRVALKETLAIEEEFIRAFRREAQLLANLNHPSLPRVFDHFSEGHGHYLVMDFIEGEDLKELSNRYPKGFPRENVLDWTRQLLEVVEYLHNQPSPILHRDIKPANIKIKNNRVFLLDFGLARGHAGQMTVTNLKKSFHGYTPNFAPPEQIQNQGTNEKSDIYSLSATIYQLLTGVVPSDGLERVMAIATGKPDTLVDIRNFIPELNENVANVLMKGLALDSVVRPQSAGAMRQEMFKPAQSSTERTLILTSENITKSIETAELKHSDLSNQNTIPQTNIPSNLIPRNNIPQNNIPPTQVFTQPQNNQQHTVQQFNQGPNNQNHFQPQNNQFFTPQNNQGYTQNFIDPGFRNTANQNNSRSNLPFILAGIFGLIIVFATIGTAAWFFIPRDNGGNDTPIIPLKSGASNRERSASLTLQAESLLQVGKYEDSIKASKEAIEADNSYAPAYAYYGDAYWDSQYSNIDKVADMPEVQKSADKILELLKEPKTAEEYMSLAWAHFAKERTDEAVKAATKSIELKPNYAAAYMIRASASRDNKKSIEDYTETLRLNPNYLQAYRNRSTCYTRLKQHNKAISDLTEAIRLLPAARFYAARGDAYLEQKNYDYAKKEYEEAAQRDPKLITAYTGMGYILYIKQKYNEALAQYQKAAEINPDASYAHNGIGNCYYSLKKWDDAIRSYTEAIRLMPDDPILYQNRASVYRQVGKNDLAKADEAKMKSLKSQAKS